MGTRTENRQQTTAVILAGARAEIAQHGGVGLSMRAVARSAGLVSSAVYRYFPTRDALLTAMIIESYERLAAQLAAVDEPTAAAAWPRLGHTLRDWALAHPHEFQLIYGTPIPGYVAPAETADSAERVAAPFLAAGAQSPIAGFDDDALAEQLQSWADSQAVTAAGAAAVMAELAALIGFVSLEIAGHFVGTADPAQHLFAALLRRQARTLGLA